MMLRIYIKYVSKEDITLKDKSVLSKKTLAQIEKTITSLLNKHSDIKAASPGNKKEKEVLLKEAVLQFTGKKIIAVSGNSKIDQNILLVRHYTCIFSF